MVKTKSVSGVNVGWWGCGVLIVEFEREKEEEEAGEVRITCFQKKRNVKLIVQLIFRALFYPRWSLKIRFRNE